MPLALLLAAASPAVPLEPNGPWLVERSTDACFLSRDYGEGDNKVTVGLQRFFAYHSMDVIILSRRGDGSQRFGRATVATSPDVAALEGGYSHAKMRVESRRYTRISLSRSLLDQMRTADTLAIKAKPVDVTVRLKSVAVAMSKLDECQGGLLRSWGVDPATVTPELAPQPLNVQELFLPKHYPMEALRSGIFGRVIAVVQVNAAGAPTACRVVASPGTVLNAGTCRQAMKLVFAPGRGLDGKPAASVHVLPVRWIL